MFKAQFFASLTLVVGMMASFGAQNVSAFPESSHTFSPKDVLKRIEEVGMLDFNRRISVTPLTVILTEPVIRTLWAGQIISNSDWIGLQALTASSYRIDPGGEDDASNMFVYTCKGGWLDFGHVIGSAIAFKAVTQAIRGNPVLRFGSKMWMSPNGEKLFNQVKNNSKSVLKDIKKSKTDIPFSNGRFFEYAKKAAKHRIETFLNLTHQKLSVRELDQRAEREATRTTKFLNDSYQQASDLDAIYYGFWGGFFAMELGYSIEFIQNDLKMKDDQKLWKGIHTSAWTLEDMPSDYYGVLLGARIERKALVGSVMKQLVLEVRQMMYDLGAVSLDSKTQGQGCKKTARDVLMADNLYYGNIAKTSRVTHSQADSNNPESPYNYTVTPKKTKSHDCVCDSNDLPFGFNDKDFEIPEKIKPKKKKRKLGPPNRR